ncbi:hypothetical protein BT67DRAFT_463150 [Trichocladium antarcticum]|uniref:Altered inheritance of mitochondria protein 19 n=1 Tax=Trichocladium antarcticum TaxID=1450529 RepID=A0AAN6UHV3_9PEZI|nr:hypothetical protein BT67DRAFT_463150 [Trichocladium antarcticum]
MAPTDDIEPPPQGLRSTLTAWGTSSIPPMSLLTLLLAQHLRPPQALPLLLAPLLAFSSYLTLAGFKTDGAGMTAAWSGMYVLLAARRRPASLRSRFSLRGGVRGTAMGLGVANTVAGLYVYGTGDRKQEEEERREVNRWGLYKD